MKHFKGKKKEEIQKKTKLPKHVERNFFFEKKIRQQGNWQKIFTIFRQENREEIFPFFYRKLHTAKKHKKKSERKRKKRLVRKKAHQIKEKTQGRKNIRKTMKKAEKKE